MKIKNFLRAGLLSFLTLISHNQIKNAINEGLLKKINIKSGSLEEVLFFDESFKEIIKNSNNYQIFSNRKKEEEVIYSEEKEFFLVNYKTDINLEKFGYNFYENFELSVKGKNLVSYLKIKNSDKTDYFLDIYLRNAILKNGSFLISNKKDKLIVNSSEYESIRAIPSRIFLIDSLTNQVDSVYIKNKIGKPDFFLPSKIFLKDSLTTEDLFTIINSYLGKNGNYYEINGLDFVCTDLITSILYSSGIDIDRAIAKSRKSNLYDTRRIRKYIEFFKKNKELKNTLYENRCLSYKDSLLKPENFNLEKFLEGQVIIFNRYYADGPLKNKLQKENVHVGIISKTSDDKKNIEKSIMVTGVGNKLSNGKYENYGVVEIKFKPYYERLQNYFSDEVTYPLYYRISKVQDLLSAINIMKKLDYNFVDIE